MEPQPTPQSNNLSLGSQSSLSPESEYLEDESSDVEDLADLEELYGTDDESDEDQFGETANEKRDRKSANFTFNPLGKIAAMTPAQRKLALGAMALEYGVIKDKDVKLRFIVGPREFRKIPGRGPGEIDAFKRPWNQLKDFSRIHNWRRILSNSFEGDYYDDSMPFIIDNLEWKTVIHYMLGMLYSKNPEYAIMYSLASRDTNVGFWGSVKAAVDEHLKNIKYGNYDPDIDYPEKVERYLFQSMLAKFTQNKVAKNALLLTEDAVISMRGGPKGILDMPVYDKVRQYILKNPTIVYKGESVRPEIREDEIPIINSSEELNVGYVSKDADDATSNALLAGRVLDSSIYKRQALKSLIGNIVAGGYLEQEPVSEGECVVYLATGAFDVSIQTLISQFGTPRFVRRHVYAMEKMADNSRERIYIGIQKTPCSVISEYIAFSTKLTSNRTIDVTIYLEPFTKGFGVLIVASDKDPVVLDMLKYLIGTSPFVSP
jgi:hypothetical protein